MKRIIIRIINKLLLEFYHFIGLFFKYDELTFIPHSTMLKYDKYDIINYRSDNSFSFFNYIVQNHLEIDLKLNVVVSDLTDIDRLKKYCNDKYPEYEIEFIPFYREYKHTFIDELIINALFFRAISHSEYIFTSATCSYAEAIVTNQKIVNLGYYSAPFKNDIFLPGDPLYKGDDKIGPKYFKYVCASELSLRLIQPSFGFRYDQYLNLGMCRNDSLLVETNYEYIKSEIISNVNYKIETIILYTPTHKDYEQNIHNFTRALMGFDINLNKFDRYLKENGVLIIAKIHPKQNFETINKQLPESIKIHTGNQNFGLCELMKISDVLMTDYTSGYFDYLLLDKPVIFNFYDFEKYELTRGFSYNPLDSILAGDIVKDEVTLYKAIENIENNRLQNRQKRQFVRDLFFTYQDTNTCKRVYDYFFRSDQNCN